MYEAQNRIVDGEANASNPPPPQRHNPPDDIAGLTYQKSAGFLGRMVNSHVHSAIQGSLQHALQETRRGSAVQSLNLDRIRESACLGTATQLCDQLTRDGPFSSFLSSLTSAAGTPSTFTTLPNGSRFDARGIPSKLEFFN